jgi:tyrosyl-tRNA synthetase
VCTLVHGADETVRAEQAAAALFGGDVSGLDERTLLDVFAEAPSTDLPRTALDDPGTLLVDVLADTGLVGSKSQARTTVGQGGAYVNNRREDDVGRRLTAADLVAGRYVVLRRGKRDHHLVRFG